MIVKLLRKPMDSSQRTRAKYEKKAGRGTRMCFCFSMEAWHIVLFKM